MQALRLRWLGGVILGALSLQAAAQTVIVSNVNGYTPAGANLQPFTGIVIRDGKVERLLTAG